MVVAGGVGGDVGHGDTGHGGHGGNSGGSDRVQWHTGDGAYASGV
jgi:hypothetical protein